jgi:hypothetical protein
MRADILVDGYGRAWRGRRTCLRLSHAGERQGAERGEAAGNEAGAAQEGATIEIAIRSAGKSRGQ